ncbi:MAG TPA: hypothetical protein VME69_03665 [Methylocella sp.]|nr:hypothetical protein [Methylocella sp.]
MHQPFFISDEELSWRVDSTYFPLLEALRDRSIKCSVGVTGSLLERCAQLRPDFIEALLEAIQGDWIMLLGTAAYHPILPWLSTQSARAQILVDREVKARLGLPTSNVFWPTELAWSMRVGALAIELGYETVVIDNCSRDAANIVPRWRSDSGGLYPVVNVDQPLGIASKISTVVSSSGACPSLNLWVRERALSNALLETMHSDEERATHYFDIFSAALESTFARAKDPSAPLVLADDPERYLPNGLTRLQGLLDTAISTSVEFVSPREFISGPCQNFLSYVPAGTMEDSDWMWSATTDDQWFRRYLDQLTLRVETACDLLCPKTEKEHDIRRKLLRVQDSGFYFWHYVSRTRRDFYLNLVEIEDWLNKLPPKHKL